MVYELRRPGGRSPRPKPESCSRWARGTFGIHVRRAALFQSIKLSREILKLLFTLTELTHPLFLLSTSFEAARRRTRYALVATERQSGGYRKTTKGKCLKRG